MDQEKRVLIAFVLSFGLLLLWRQFAVKTSAPQPKSAQPIASQAPPASKPAQPPPAPPASGAARASRRNSKIPAESKPAALPVKKGSAPQEITIEGDVYTTTLSSRGGIVNSWVLKKYKDEKGQPLDL